MEPTKKYVGLPEKTKNKNRKAPTDTLISGKQIWVNQNSYEFHLEYWKTFSEKINSVY